MHSPPGDNLVDAFREKGLCFPIRVLAPGDAAEYRRRCDELEAALGGTPRTVEVRQMHLHFPWAYELATRPEIVDAVEPLLGPNLIVWATELFAKHPQSAHLEIGWHRDRAYIGFPPEDVVTAWVALTDSGTENGCMQAVPEPDRFGAVPAGDRSAERVPGDSIDQSRAIDVELQAGEMSLHDPWLLHGSSPNLSDRDRVGFVIRFVRADSRPLHGRPPVVVARGEASPERFEIVEPPGAQDVDPEALRASARRHLDTILLTLGRAKP